jgi:hypothetical protein
VAGVNVLAQLVGKVGAPEELAGLVLVVVPAMARKVAATAQHRKVERW